MRGAFILPVPLLLGVKRVIAVLFENNREIFTGEKRGGGRGLIKGGNCPPPLASSPLATPLQITQATCGKSTFVLNFVRTNATKVQQISRLALFYSTAKEAQCFEHNEFQRLK